jgi:hypothetical protein
MPVFQENGETERKNFLRRTRQEGKGNRREKESETEDAWRRPFLMADNRDSGKE